MVKSKDKIDSQHNHRRGYEEENGLVFVAGALHVAVVGTSENLKVFDSLNCLFFYHRYTGLGEKIFMLDRIRRTGSKSNKIGKQGCENQEKRKQRNYDGC